jgi:hypothetical protein
MFDVGRSLFDVRLDVRSNSGSVRDDLFSIVIAVSIAGSSLGRPPFFRTQLRRINVNEFRHVGKRNGCPSVDHVISVITHDRFQWQNCAGGADDDRAGVEYIHGLIIRQPNTKRLERLVVQFVQQVAVSHGPDYIKSFDSVAISFVWSMPVFVL